jgi:iron complex transport system ATP-binding protein
MIPKIAVRNATFSYGDAEVWRELHLEVKAGETLCILGPNGCGKTTLLNCIHGDLGLKSGQIMIDGIDVRTLGVKEIARKIGYVFQEHSIPFPYSVLEIIRMGRAPYLGIFEGPSTADTRIAQRIMASLGISLLANKRYTEISGGERQLVLIARTLCQEPDVILLDEPTSHLDLKNQAVVLKTVKQLSEEGLTIIITTHFPNHAWLFTGKAVLMNEGKFVAVGAAAEVMTEENLSGVYGIRVRVISAGNDDDKIKFCSPVY